MGQTIPGFRECLAAVLRTATTELPEPPPGEPEFRVWQQWLAERQLGLVPVADAAGFEWAGCWIGITRARGGGTRAVVMFGLPSGPILDPVGGDASTDAMEAGYVVAPLGAAFLREPATGDLSLAGTVEAVLIASAAEAPLARVPSARALAGRGLEHDRYSVRAGTFGRTGGNGYDLTLIEAEALEELAADGVPLSFEEARRNVVTRGIDLNALVGRAFRVGDVECVGRRLAEPCAHLQRLTRDGVLRGLVHRAGLRADVLTDGRIAVGDEVRGS